ncbi:hypothetical protein JXR93_03410 [bacterium]|nr:hypothetical protein [bacterium]
MIEEIVKIHDKHQIEIKLNYKLEENKKFADYIIDTYMFLPNSLDINRETYSKQNFYNNIQSYIRLKTPTVLIQNLVKGECSPFDRLEKIVESVVKNSTRFEDSDYEHQIQIYCSIFKSALRDHVHFIEEKTESEDLELLIDKYIEEVPKAVIAYRGLRAKITVPTLTDSQFTIFTFGDEYISLMTEYFSFQLFELIPKKKISDESKKKYEKQLIDIIKFETDYRRLHKYPSIKKDGSDNEEFLYRRSVLKKYISSILFLNVRTQNDNKVMEQLLYSIAAGAAMIFATSVAFLTQQTYGNFTYPFFVALVVSYMFKDRIKELMRGYFNQKIQSKFYDHKTDIFINSRDKNIGFAKERVSFVSQKYLSDSIKKIRNIDQITSLDNLVTGENILLYRKNIKINSLKLKKYYKNFTVEGINDIIRLGIADFLKKMDNSETLLHFYKESQHKKIKGDRVYHINLVIQYKMDKVIEYRRFRIVANREGIKRIEKVGDSSF